MSEVVDNLKHLKEVNKYIKKYAHLYYIDKDVIRMESNVPYVERYITINKDMSDKLMPYSGYVINVPEATSFLSKFRKTKVEISINSSSVIYEDKEKEISLTLIPSHKRTIANRFNSKMLGDSEKYKEIYTNLLNSPTNELSLEEKISLLDKDTIYVDNRVIINKTIIEPLSSSNNITYTTDIVRDKNGAEYMLFRQEYLFGTMVSIIAYMAL